MMAGGSLGQSFLQVAVEGVAAGEQSNTNNGLSLRLFTVATWKLEEQSACKVDK